MTKNIIILFFLFACLTGPFQMRAQVNQSKSVKVSLVKAQVVDIEGNPVANVKVLGNEGSVQTRTNTNGLFELEIKSGSTILIEAPGFSSVATSQGQLNQNSMKVTIEKLKDLKIDALVQLPYKKMNLGRTTGNISVIDVKKSFDTDTRLEVNAHLGGKVTGNYGSFDFHGLGRAVIVVDGMVRDISYIRMLDIEQIVVLKDAYSRMLYGADGDVPVVLVTTKSGEKNKKVLNVNIEHGILSPISKPKYLDAASYMETYNKAFKNDGGLVNPFSTGRIDSTRNNYDPVLFPNNDYYGSKFVRNTTNYTNVFTEASGGNEKVQYLLNLGWVRHRDWLAMPKNDNSNSLNLRGKVNFDITNSLKMFADVVAVFDLYNGPRTSTFFNDASTMLPHLFPLLIPRNRIANDSLLSGKDPIGNSLLGGTVNYKQNLMADMLRGGTRSDLNRYLQYTIGFDLDLKKITKGLSLSGRANIDFSNFYSQFVDRKYAVYEISSKPNDKGQFNVTQIGQDVFTNKQSLSDDLSSFGRNYNGNVFMNYDRAFGKHQISAVAMGYYNQRVTKGIEQDLKRLRFGGQVNYTYDDRFLIEAGVIDQFSNKMNPESRNALTPSVGAGWVISNESFLKNNSVVNYLKLRGTYGVIANDNWNLGSYNGYFLYEQNYSKPGYFTYANGLQGNSTVGVQSLGSSYDLQLRKEFVGGLDMYLFDKKLWFETSYWNSLSANNLVNLSNNTSSVVGLTPVANFNSTRYQGVELGLNYNESFGNLKLNVGLNYVYSKSKIEKYDEPIYADNNKHLSRVGTSESDIYGLSSLGFYSPEDFETDGMTLKSTLPLPSWGVVKVGDIKYKDINDDDILNSDDRSVIGKWGSDQQLSLNFDLSYKNWQLFVLGGANWGGSGMKTSKYYWFRGNEAKYSAEALKSFDPNAPDYNAEYPRLSLTNGNNNYQYSTFWMYNSASFYLSNVQLSYNIDLMNSFVKSMKIYAKGANLLAFGKNVEIMQLNTSSAPQTRVFSLGLIANF